MSDFNSTINIKLTCKHCGSNDLEIPDDATDESMVTCKGCNTEVGKWGDVQQAAKDAARDEIDGELKKMFKDPIKINIKF